MRAFVYSVDMRTAQPFSLCPEQLLQGEQSHPVVWQRDRAVVARPDSVDAELFRVIDAAEYDNSCCPVYRQHAGTVPAVATGKVFVRCAEGMAADSIVERIGMAQLVVVNAPHWAPNTAWIAAADQSPCTTLSVLQQLRALAGVVSADPQLLMQVQRRERPLERG